MSEEPSESRRSALKVLIGLGSAAVGAVLALPGVSYVVDPLLRSAGKRERWVPVADLEGLSEEHPVAVPVVDEQTDAWTTDPAVRLGVVWLRKKGEKVHALTAECPHLGCKVDYQREDKHFACPCHESKFTPEGDVRGGPAPRGLDPLDTRVVDGKVEVRFARFRAQVAERVEIG
ncbi:MAG: Rieske (2Fe-2S) protein [Myxococcales bacterium]|nr:Rieske (2Fe-2S) protein [Myxococcales bacterium]